MNFKLSALYQETKLGEYIYIKKMQKIMELEKDERSSMKNTRE